MTNKIAVTKIVITRAEGPFDMCRVPVDEPIECADWEEASEVLRRISRDIADWNEKAGMEPMGYDKTDFVIHFADGTTYEGRADVEADGTDTNLVEHVRGYLEFLAGLSKPGHLKERDWLRVCANYEREGLAAKARAYLETYEIPESHRLSP